jgi:SAM-dependent methyltransferase
MKRYFMAANIFRRVHKIVFERMLGRVFAGRQEDALRHSGTFKRSVRRFNQFLNEKGLVSPWIYTKKECLEFWQSMDNSSLSTGNRPEKYSSKKKNILVFLDRLWSPDVEKTDRILEVGCNCGANLYWLSELGYKTLCGVEINPSAVEQMEASFPELSKKTDIFTGSLEEYFAQKEDKSVDVIFSMGVSMHIHPGDNYIFSEMVRVARKYICTVEPESANSNYVFARNYRRVFELLGCCQLRSGLVTEDILPNSGYAGCTVRVMKIKAE